LGPLVMPVAGVSWEELQDSFGDPRSGGRSHRGIDIFAPRWSEVVAVTSGTLSSIGHLGRAGRSLWLMGRDGRSYFYGHLEAWASGIRDGMDVGAGELVGYVGNSGNASRTPTHLHFEIHENGRAINPHPVLASAEPTYGTGRVASRRPRSRRGV
jgi:murein DD-endopeptidase MepM/ murein hydrolase activator NlpD